MIFLHLICYFCFVLIFFLFFKEKLSSRFFLNLTTSEFKSNYLYNLYNRAKVRQRFTKKSNKLVNPIQSVFLEKKKVMDLIKC